INESVAYSNMKRNDQAEACLRRALETEPASAAANFNLGLLLAEQGRAEEAEKALRMAIKSDSRPSGTWRPAAAAYNLGVILAGRKNMTEAIAWCRKACELQPDEAKYAQGLTLYLYQEGDADGAIEVLRKALGNEKLPAQARQELETKLQSLEAAESDKKRNK
ncbi:MAG: tetratricopeptide repeat protein, partial [Thermoguttaceae bacterium]